jgi:plasmid replication initiation protein
VIPLSFKKESPYNLAMVKIVPNQYSLFIADALDIAVKGDVSIGAENFFSLSKKPRFEPIVHQLPKGKITITPTSGNALATVYDESILLFLISQLVHGADKGEPLGKTIYFSGFDYFHFIQKHKIGGKDYEEIWKALERLKTTYVELEMNGIEGSDAKFNWLSFIQKDWITNKKGEKQAVGFHVEVPNRLVKAVEDRRVLTLDRRYFKMRSPVERWIYRFVRKSVGRATNENFKYWSWEKLHKKSASTDTLTMFKKTTRAILKRSDYRLFQYTVEEAQRGMEKGLYFDLSPYAVLDQGRPLMIDGTRNSTT